MENQLKKLYFASLSDQICKTSPRAARSITSPCMRRSCSSSVKSVPRFTGNALLVMPFPLQQEAISHSAHLTPVATSKANKGFFRQVCSVLSKAWLSAPHLGNCLETMRQISTGFAGKGRHAGLGAHFSCTMEPHVLQV